MYVTHHYLIQFLILGVALASPPPQDGWGGVQVARRVLLVVTRLGPEVLRLLLHLDGPDLAVQRERGHTQALVLLIAVKIIEIPAAIIMS